ncbi:plasmid mobilization relaxosome protein MobC [Acetobacter lambici]|uniref:MobC family plasmid mobilization relaxosome protein n=1 Tax=Acetobacter lambici TaxID=1332824 RepID=A0ABT1F119_9PROT|nr:plasmid mobilization relaxosome protein MobC [Acetobacter lambici]MCP1242742.1 MobC family plasmid mobilization relaxosome protein [Acetobacter lambici]MCP1258885.1 MobC family plasmid mobilization relaxosome protein [Acetobacter lambici]NHO57393.1 plasmid mobilization relaxosome protein MobC [Acetobacter lambici]
MKDKMIHIRVSDEEHQRIHAYAKQRKKKVSVIGRSSFLNDISGGAKIADELAGIRKELAQIGNNINQIAHKLNAGENADISRLPEIINSLRNNVNAKLKRVR